jgi:hypothetical protein
VHVKNSTRLFLTVSLAAACALQSAPASAAFSYLSPAQTQAKQCQDTRAAGDFAGSLQVCLAAAATFKAIGDGEKRNPWYSYEVEGKMLEVAANDYAALGKHRQALDTALQAHQLLLFVYRTYKMDEDDYAGISAVTARLAQFEAVERRKV